MIQSVHGTTHDLARNEGIEPPSSVLEAEVLPLDEFRMKRAVLTLWHLLEIYGSSPYVNGRPLAHIRSQHSHRESNPVREGENLASYPMDDGSKVSCTGIEPVFPD